MIVCRHRVHQFDDEKNQINQLNDPIMAELSVSVGNNSQ